MPTSPPRLNVPIVGLSKELEDALDDTALDARTATLEEQFEGLEVIVVNAVDTPYGGTVAVDNLGAEDLLLFALKVTFEPTTNMLLFSSISSLVELTDEQEITLYEDFGPDEGLILVFSDQVPTIDE